MEENRTTRNEIVVANQYITIISAVVFMLLLYALLQNKTKQKTTNILSFYLCIE